MTVEHYSFGNMIINGKKYVHDLIIFPHTIKDHWIRTEGHNLHWEDLTEILKEKPEIIIIGNGAYGVMTVNKNLIKKLEDEGFKVYVKHSAKAVELYNELSSKSSAVLAIHLTC